MRVAHTQRAVLAWDRSTGMGIKCPKETLSNTRHCTQFKQYKLEIKAAIKVIRLPGLLTLHAFLVAEAAADLLVHSLGLRSQHSPALARANSPGAVLVRQPASLLALCLFSEKKKKRDSLFGDANLSLFTVSELAYGKERKTNSQTSSRSSASMYKCSCSRRGGGGMRRGTRCGL